MNLPISIYIPVFRHHHFLDEILAACFKYSDDVIICDGAYEHSTQFLETMGISPDVSDQETLDIINKYPVRYYSGVWTNEPAKHTFGYDNAKYDLVMSIDTDEIIDLNLEEFAKFISSGKFAGSVMNIEPADAVGYELRRYPKNKIFNKKNEKDIKHYDYLPLLRCYGKNEIPKLDTIYTTSVGTLYHLHALRPAYEQYFRIIMYYGITNRKSDDVIGTIQKEVLEKLGFDRCLQIFESNLFPHSEICRFTGKLTDFAEDLNTSVFLMPFQIQLVEQKEKTSDIKNIKNLTIIKKNTHFISASDLPDTIKILSEDLKDLHVRILHKVFEAEKGYIDISDFWMGPIIFKQDNVALIDFTNCVANDIFKTYIVFDYVGNKLFTDIEIM